MYRGNSGGEMRKRSAEDAERDAQGVDRKGVMGWDVPPHLTRRSRGRRKLARRGPGQSPDRQRIWFIRRPENISGDNIL